MTMKTINAKRHIAAFGTMLVASIGVTTFAAPTAGLDGDVYYVNVPAGETVSATDASWSSWVSAASGHPFAKRGGGTLTAGAAMASFAGEIRIEGGIYAVSADGGLGTTAGGTVVSNNATLLIAGGTHTSEPLYFSGNGCESGKYGGYTLSNPGAFWRWGGSTTFDKVTLLGDATFRGNGSEIGGTLNLNGHTLTLKLDKSTYYTTIKRASIPTMGNIVLETGGIWFSSLASVASGGDWSVTVKANGFLYNWGTTSGAKLPWRLVFENGGSIRSGSGTVVWSGPVSIPYSVKVDRYTESWAGWFTGARLDGVVSGNGSLDIRNGEVLALTNSGNDYTGSIAVNGINLQTNSTLKISNNALPATSAGVTMNYGNVELNGSVSSIGVDTNKFSLPKLACTSSGSVVCKDTLAVSGNKQTVKEISKSGSGVMTLTGPICVTGLTEVVSGTLRLGSRPPAVQTGLECYFFDYVHSQYYSRDTSGSWTYITSDPDSLMRQIGWWTSTKMQIPYAGIDTNGISLAYKAWPVQFMDVVYKGYLWIDGDVPVTWNFAGDVVRHLWLRIDGQDVFHNKDNYSGRTMYRFEASKAITLTPGAHSFWLYMANNGGSGSGPWSYTNEGSSSARYWAGNMGVAYNPNPGEVISSNSTDYVKFTGSQFSPTADRGKANIDSSLYRASFEGGAKFATGTVFDIGDAAPYTPFTLASLEGAMTVTNGTLVLSGNWTIDAAEVNAGGLVLAGDANLVFADGATLTVTNAGQILHKGTVGMPLVTCAGTGTVTGRPTILMEEGGWKLDEKDGNLNIHRPIGIILIVQ